MIERQNVLIAANQRVMSNQLTQSLIKYESVHLT